MSEERRVLGVDQRLVQWQSTLTGALLRWTEGWEVYADIGGVAEWRPYRAGTATATVYARAGETFMELM